MKCSLVPVRFVLTAGVLFTVPFLSTVFAQSLADLAGTWNNVMFSTPARLTLVRDHVQFPGQGEADVLRDIPEKGYFEMSTGRIVAQANGSFTGFASGTFSLASGGRMVVTVPSNAPITFHMNAARDFMFAVKYSDEEAIQDIELLLNAPPAMTAAEMAGPWTLVSLGTPARLVLEKETLFNTYVTNVAGGDEFSVHTGTVTVHADGTVLVDNDGEILPGTCSFPGAGGVDVTLSVPQMGSFTLHFYANASKNIMAAINPMNPESHEIALLLRQPTNSNAAEFKGLWRDGTFVTPAMLTQNRAAYGVVTDIHERNDFELSLGDTLAGHNGDLTFPSEPAVGFATFPTPDTLAAAITNAAGEVKNETFWVNAGKDVLVTVRAEEGNRITLATRAPAESVRSESLGMTLLGSTIFWASDTNCQLQVSTNLNSWDALTHTLGQGSYSVNPAAATKGFFRVMRTP